MSDYVKSTDFAVKDGLVTGNPLKIISGTEINTEFNNIQTAVATKADLASPALTGNPTAPTQAALNNTTRVATTAFVRTAVESLYPVGSVYINASDATNPATLFGFGTWTAFATGRMLVAINAADTSFDTIGETGGSKDAVLVSHTHTASVTDPGHGHTFPRGLTDLDQANIGGGRNAAYDTYTTASATTGISVGISTVGVSATNANLPPYIVVYMWRRTA